jgi:hypothetical protein
MSQEITPFEAKDESIKKLESKARKALKDKKKS